MSNNKPNESLGVNKIGKNIRKSPFNQPDVTNNNNNQTKQKPQPHIYNINKNDFRSFVQQVTGSSSHQDQFPKPENNPPSHSNTRLQRIRPPPLSPITHPRVRQVARFVQTSPRSGVHPPLLPALSPISAFMQQLESCIGDQARSLTPHPMAQPQVPGQVYAPETQMKAQPDVMQARFHGQKGQANILSPSSSGGFYNLLSPYNFLSPPGVQYQPPLSPIFSFSPIGQSGIWQPPISPGFVFPRSPS